MYHFEKKILIFSPEGPRENVWGPARMLLWAPLWLSTGLLTTTYTSANERSNDDQFVRPSNRKSDHGLNVKKFLRFHFPSFLNKTSVPKIFIGPIKDLYSFMFAFKSPSPILPNLT